MGKSLLFDFAAVAVAFALGIIIGYGARKPEVAIAAEQARAIKAGVGYYALSAKSGKIEFEYLDLPGYTAYILGASRAPKIGDRQ